MFRLIVKDFKVAGIFWLPALILYLLSISTFVQVNLVYLLVNMVIAFILVLAVPIVEDTQRLEPFLCSLPLKRRQVVGARYLSAGMILLASLAIMETAAPLFSAVFEIEGARPGILLSPAGALSFLLPMIVFLSLFLPLYFRLGLGKALSILPIVILALSAFFGAVIRLAAWLIHEPWTAIFPLDAEIGVVPYKPFLPLASRLTNSLGTPAGWALILLAGGVIVALSLRVSIRCYEKKDL
ncbi:MAG: ABC-2 transporter permease [Candidatus Aminicenantes bacterium]|nr:ABC-2 transporter permease [Candidatus Aminicenantes bacterium]